jgi:hypothetical protein
MTFGPEAGRPNLPTSRHPNAKGHFLVAAAEFCKKILQAGRTRHTLSRQAQKPV